MKYRLAEGAADYTLCRELMAAEGFPELNIDFPTVMALDEAGEVVGMLGTIPDNDMVLAGPLVLRSDKRRPMLAVRMINLYEMTMRGLGISQFVFQTPRGGFLDQGVERYFPHMKPYAEEGDDVFYLWPVRQEAVNG
jgi:hypothetical protein